MLVSLAHFLKENIYGFSTGVREVMITDNTFTNDHFSFC